MEPMRVLTDAIKAVPAVKYALGMAGVAAAVAIVAGLFKDIKIAALGSVIMLGLMFMLFVFAQHVKHGASDSRPLALVLAWTFCILTAATSTLIFSSFFFSWPRPLEGYFGNVETPGRATPDPAVTKSAQTSPTETSRPAVPSQTISPEGAPTPPKEMAPKGAQVSVTPSKANLTRDREDMALRFTVRLVVPSDMSDAQVTVNGAPADIENRLPTAIFVRVKPQKTNTIIRLSGKRECNPIEQIIDGNEVLTVNCR